MNPTSELYRSLAVVVEPPTDETARLVALLELGTSPHAGQHHDLFESQLYPYASVYLDDSGMLGGEARDRIAGFWRALSIEPPQGVDHLAVMLASLAKLSELAVDSDSNGAERARHAREVFVIEHLLTWLPVYLDKVIEVAVGCYRAWAELLIDLLRRETRSLVAPSSLPVHLDSSSPLADPRRDGGPAFLQSLLAPVRSGVVWVRSDLHRAANDLELGARVAERRFFIEALLAQDAGATLTWLANDAERWVDRHLARESWTGSIARFWAARAQATRALLADLAAGDIDSG